MYDCWAREWVLWVNKPIGKDYQWKVIYKYCSGIIYLVKPSVGKRMKDEELLSKLQRLLSLKYKTIYGCKHK